MEISTSAEFRQQALMLLRIERIQYNEQMVLLGYREEQAVPVKRRRLVRRAPPTETGGIVKV
jgi:hypothetical protein